MGKWVIINLSNQMLWQQLEIKLYLFIRSQTVTGAGPLDNSQSSSLIRAEMF